MWLKSVQIEGFQSFADTGPIELSKGINLIIGQNNAGKSAFLRALLPQLADDRHRTPERWEDHKTPIPKISMALVLDGPELYDVALRYSQSFFPLPPNTDHDAEAYMGLIFAGAELPIYIHRIAGSAFTGDYPSHRLFEANVNMSNRCALCEVRNSRMTVHLQHRGEDSLPILAENVWGRDMFYFAAERMMVGQSGQGYANRLDPNARNLPNVLHTLSSERGDTFQKLVRHLREIFPTVGNLSVRTSPTGMLEIRVWPTESMQRVELSFPLDNGGTGVAQIISILTAIMTVENAVIIIDEINSFIHPSAMKSLLRIIQTLYSQHQYIISTHSPDVISFSNPSTVHLVKRAGYTSTIEALDLDDINDFRDVAEHLGVSMTDVFAAENVIWVEGPTEELCFPFIYHHLVCPLPRGTVFISVAATGDFGSNKRDPAIVYEVYERLSSAASALVVSVAFSFDSERLTEPEKTEMCSKSKGLLHFLPRRHFECYLVSAPAIAAFIVSKNPELEGLATETLVRQEIERAAEQPKFFVPQWQGSIVDPDWLAAVDAAKLIIHICDVVSENTAPFNKKKDSLFLLRNILENDAGRLDGLRDYVVQLVDRAD